MSKVWQTSRLPDPSTARPDGGCGGVDPKCIPVLDAHREFLGGRTSGVAAGLCSSSSLLSRWSNALSPEPTMGSLKVMR